MSNFETTLNSLFQLYFMLFFKKLRTSFKKTIETIMIGNNQINKNSLNVQKNLNIQENDKNTSNPAKTDVIFFFV